MILPLHGKDTKSRRDRSCVRSLKENVLTRIAAITPAHREHLRQLKAEFEAAYGAVEDPFDRASPSFRAAEARYRTWLKAIDSHALALLDDLDALDIGGGGPRPASSMRESFSPVSPVRASDVDHVYSDMEDVLHVLDLIDKDDGSAPFRVPLPAKPR